MSVENIYERNLENLHVGYFSGVRGVVETAEGDVPLNLGGELVMFAQAEGDELNIMHLQRFLIRGQPVAPQEDDPLELLSLGGPLPDVELSSGGNAIEGILMHMQYRLLLEDDPFTPRFEIIEVAARWEGIEQRDEGGIQLIGFQFETGALFDTELGYVGALRFAEDAKPPDVLLRQATLQVGIDVCGELEDCPPASPQDLLRYVPLRFVNLTGQDVKADCKHLLDEACKIWRRKAAVGLGLPIDWTVEDVPSSEWNLFNQFDDNRDRTRLLLLPARSAEQVEIYIVESVAAPDADNGVTYFQGSSFALCLLALEKMQEAPRLLAHELCHVLGLGHIDDVDERAGSPDSIADTSIPLFSDQNSNHNRRLLIDQSWPLAPYWTTNILVPYCPDF